MQATCMNSSLSIRCRVSRSLYFDDPTYLLDANPLLISSSLGSSCCCCCCCAANENSSYNWFPRINPSFFCIGLRQSTLIQFSPSKRFVIQGSRRQLCNRNSWLSPLTDFGPSYHYEKPSSFKERRKLLRGSYACSVHEDKKKEQPFSNEIDDDYVDEVGMLLDLLTEEVGLEKICVKSRKRVQKNDSINITGKKKTVYSGSVKQDLKCNNKAAEIQFSEQEDRRLSSKRRNLVRGNHERKKEGSSCSSYYSVSSTGEYDSDNDVQIKHDDSFVAGEASSEYIDDQKMDSYSRIYDGEVNKEETEISKKNMAETYYTNQEWRKKSEKKLDVDSSQHQSQISLNTELNKKQHNIKVDRISDQSQSRLKNKTRMESSVIDNRVVIESSSSTQKRKSDVENKLITSAQELTSEHKRETSDHVTRQDKYRKQSNVIFKGIDETEKRMGSYSSSSLAQEVTSEHKGETSDQVVRQDEYRKHSNVIFEGVDETNKRMGSSSSSSLLDNRMTNWEEHLTKVSDRFEDQSEERHVRTEQFTTSKESRVKSQQTSEISDTHIINTKNIRRQSDIRSEKQLHLGTSSSAEKVTMFSSSSGVKMVEGTTEESKKAGSGRRTTKASSFHVGMPKAASSSYKALKLIPEPNVRQTDAHGADSSISSSLPITMASSSAGVKLQEDASVSAKPNVKQTDAHGADSSISSSHLITMASSSAGGELQEDAIVSADEQQKSSGHFVGEFVEKAKHELSTSKIQQEMKNTSSEEVKATSASGAEGPSDEMWHETSSSGESLKRSSRSLWNVIGDVVRLRWASPRSETNTPKSGSAGGKASSYQSVNSERWFSGHEADDSNDENVKLTSTKFQKESPDPSSSKEKLDSPLLYLSNTNQESSSKTMSPLEVEESSPLQPSIRMRRSTGSGKMEQMVSKPADDGASGSGSGKEDEARRKLARINQVSKDRFDEWEEAYTIEAKQQKDDEFFMREALLEAKKAADFWEVPVGAVLVQDGKVIARGYNLVEELRDSTAHAEMVCIREASNNLRSWRLSGTTLYVTLEPCPMCAGAILQARIDTLVWGAPNKLLGADGSWIRLFPAGDGGNGPDKPSAPVHPFHPNMTVRRGVLSAECADVMQQFFQLRRKKKDKKTEAASQPPPSPPSPSPSPPSCLPITHHRQHHSKFFTKLHDTFNIMFCL